MFDKQESFVKWYKAILDATGDYRIENYYVELPNTMLDACIDSNIYKGINKLTKQEVAIKKFIKEDRYDFY